MSDPAWTTPTQIDEHVKRVWLRGDLLREPLGDARYPLRRSTDLDKRATGREC
jgi:hypothetical protein